MTAWAGAAVAAVTAWVLMAVVTAFMFSDAYGSASFTYTGQVDDRHGAWLLLLFLLLLTLIIAFGFVWPLVRWKRLNRRASSRLK